MNKLLEQGLEIKKISSTRAEGRVSLDEDKLREKVAATMKGDASVVAWYFERIIFGRCSGGVVTLADGTPLTLAGLEELRVFNTSEELRIVNDGRRLRTRYIADGAGDATEVVDSAARLWGERADGAPDGYTRLLDSGRHIELTVPADIKHTGVLVTRNYIECDKLTGLAGYGDYRYVEISGEE